MKIALFWIAVTGWTLALLVHILSIFDVDVQGKAPYVWLLHIGIFVVYVPAILSLRKNTRFKTFESSGTPNRIGPFGLFKALFERAPSWMVVIVVAGLFYAFVNFLVSMGSLPGTPAVKDGQYYLHNHGHWMRNITEREYRHYKAATVRGFSGHWIAFYGLAAAMLYPFKTPDSKGARKIF